MQKFWPAYNLYESDLYSSIFNISNNSNILCITKLYNTKFWVKSEWIKRHMQFINW